MDRDPRPWASILGRRMQSARTGWPTERIDHQLDAHRIRARAIAFKDAAVLGELTGPTAGLPVAGMLTRLAHTLKDD